MHWIKEGKGRALFSVAWGLVLLAAITQASWQRRGVPLAEEMSAQALLKGAIFALLGFLGFWRLLKNPGKFRLTLAHGFGALFFLWANVSALYSPLPHLSFFTAASSVAIFVYLLSLSDKERQDREVVLRSVFLGLTILTLSSGIAYFLVPALFVEKVGYVTRLRGLAGHPNALAEAAGATIIFFVLLYLPKWYFDSRWKFLLGLVLLASSVLILWATNGRAAMIALFLTLLLAGMVDIVLRRKERILALLGLVLVLIAVGSVISPWQQLEAADWEAILSALSRRRRPEEIMTLTGRTGIWQEVGHLIEENMITGYGYRSGEDVLLSLGLPVHTHNMYLELLFSLGLVGTFLFLIVLGWTGYRNLWRWLLFGDGISRTRSALLLFIVLVGLTNRAAVGNTTILFVLFWALVVDTFADDYRVGGGYAMESRALFGVERRPIR